MSNGSINAFTFTRYDIKYHDSWSFSIVDGSEFAACVFMLYITVHDTTTIAKAPPEHRAR